MSHTPGPWTMDSYGNKYNAEENTYEKDDTQGRWRIEEPGIDVHPIWSGSANTEQYPDGVIISKEESDANARLICAAPELLVCLQELVDLMKDVVSGDYKPDSFTTQPAEFIIRRVLKGSNHDFGAK